MVKNKTIKTAAHKVKQEKKKTIKMAHKVKQDEQKAKRYSLSEQMVVKLS